VNLLDDRPQQAVQPHHLLHAISPFLPMASSARKDAVWTYSTGGWYPSCYFAQIKIHDLHDDIAFYVHQFLWEHSGSGIDQRRGRTMLKLVRTIIKQDGEKIFKLSIGDNISY
jgi:hypothetical protein